MQLEWIVTAQEMKRVEELSIAEGASERAYMEQAGCHIAEEVAKLAIKSQVTLLCGKGNNAGDAFTAGRYLLEKGVKVEAVQLRPDVESALCEENRKKFQQKGGQLQLVDEHSQIAVHLKGILLDGIFGTGFRGQTEGAALALIQAANQSNLPIIAIDIPSGINGTTGVSNGCIKAQKTLYLEMPKQGFFAKEGWENTGDLQKISFGLGNYQQQAAHQALLAVNVAPFFPPIKRAQHKYQAGYIVSFAGSLGYAGAASLSALGAMRSGSGLVRLFYPEEMLPELSALPREIVKEMWQWSCRESFLKEAKRAKAQILGPGIGREPASAKMLFWILKNVELPAVIDADALYHIAEKKAFQFPQHSILTPHHGEMKRLLHGHDPNWTRVQEFVEKKQVTLLLKGSPTVIFHPQSLPVVIPEGHAAMATAGMGDVLTGMVATMLAKGWPPREAAIKAAKLHALAALSTIKAQGPIGLLASDVLHHIPRVVDNEATANICASC